MGIPHPATLAGPGLGSKVLSPQGPKSRLVAISKAQRLSTAYSRPGHRSRPAPDSNGDSNRSSRRHAPAVGSTQGRSHIT